MYNIYIYICLCVYIFIYVCLHLSIYLSVYREGLEACLLPYAVGDCVNADEVSIHIYIYYTCILFITYSYIIICMSTPIYLSFCPS